MKSEFECYLLQLSVDGQRFGAVEDTDVVQSEEAAREDVLAPGIFPVYPPEGKQNGRLERCTMARRKPTHFTSSPRRN